MNLHENQHAFNEIIIATAEGLHIDERIIEKDYYVTILLKELKKKLPDMVFKGGTSLSKCYDNVINHFSEDIDISYSMDSHKSGTAKRRELKTAVVEAIHALGLDVYNLHEIGSRRDYNCYRAAYHSIYKPFNTLKNDLIVETYVALLPFPTEIRKASNFIFQFLQKESEYELIASYNLKPFEILTQDIRRTLIDKVFALCDYYLSGKLTKHSRHIYDIYELKHFIQSSEDMTLLAGQVRTLRKDLPMCPSASDEVNINRLLKEIITSKAYEPDYQNVTERLLFTSLPYNEAITSLDAIIDSGIFSFPQPKSNRRSAIEQNRLL